MKFYQFPVRSLPETNEVKIIHTVHSSLIYINTFNVSNEETPRRKRVGKLFRYQLRAVEIPLACPIDAETHYHSTSLR